MNELIEKFLNPIEFNSLLKESKSIIVGGMVAHHVFPTTFDDMDILTTKYSPMVDYILSNGYILTPLNEPSQYINNHQIVSRFSSCFTLMKEDKKIQVILVEDILKSLLTFDLSMCATYWDGEKIYNPLQSLSTLSIGKGYIIYYNQKRINKYYLRGWKLDKYSEFIKQLFFDAFANEPIELETDQEEFVISMDKIKNGDICYQINNHTLYQAEMLMDILLKGDKCYLTRQNIIDIKKVTCRLK